MARPDFPVALAVVAGAHGVQGEVRLKLFATSADSLRRHTQFLAGSRPLTLLGVRGAGDNVIARFAEVTDRSAAEALRGLELSVPRSALPDPADGEVYWCDLVGLDVVTPDGAAAGRVVAVENYGASDLIEVERLDGRRVLVPLVPDAVPEIADPLVVDLVWLDG